MMKKYKLGWISFTITIIIFLIYILQKPSNHFDDSYMYIRYAVNLLHGFGIAWNPGGEHIYGCTSIPFLFIVAFFKLIFPAINSGNLLVYISALFGLLSILTLPFVVYYYLENRLFKNIQLIIIIIFPLTFLHFAFIFHSARGMETTLAFFINIIFLLSLKLATNKDSNLAYILAGIIAFLPYFIRQDNILYSLLFSFLYLQLIAKSCNKKKLLFFIPLLILLIIDSYVKYKTFGDILPLPFYAKKSSNFSKTGFLELFNPFTLFADYLLYLLPFIVIIIFFIDKRIKNYAIAFLIPFILTCGYYFTFIHIMGFDFRYFFPFTPYIIILAFKILEQDIDINKDKFLNIIKYRVPIFLLMILSIIYVKYFSEKIYNLVYLKGKNYHFYEKRVTSLPSLGWWDSIVAFNQLLNELPDNIVIASSENGLISASHTNIKIIDLSGLHDKYYAYHGFSAKNLMERNPDIIWFPTRTYNTIITDIINNNEFKDKYKYFPDAYENGLAVNLNRPDLIMKVKEVMSNYYKINFE
jgi:hypothetical protein